MVKTHRGWTARTGQPGPLIVRKQHGKIISNCEDIRKRMDYEFLDTDSVTQEVDYLFQGEKGATGNGFTKMAKDFREWCLSIQARMCSDYTKRWMVYLNSAATVFGESATQ